MYFSPYISVPSSTDSNTLALTVLTEGNLILAVVDDAAQVSIISGRVIKTTSLLL